MTRKKNGFLTLVFSCLPGAGEMYMGFMKQGTSLMGAFFLFVFLASWLHIGPLLFVLPVLWFYGFFHVHNLRSLPDEEFYAVEDEYLFHLDQILPMQEKLGHKARILVAVGLIFIGAAMLLDNLQGMLSWYLPAYITDQFWHIQRMLPQFVFSVLLIAGGIWLVRGKKRELDEQEARQQEDKGGDSL